MGSVFFRGVKVLGLISSFNKFIGGVGRRMFAMIL